MKYASALLLIGFIATHSSALAAPSETMPSTREQTAAATVDESGQAEVAAKFARMQQTLADGNGDGSLSAKSAAAKPIHPALLGLEVLFALAGVLVLAVITVRLLKRAQKGLLGGRSATVSGELLEIAESLHLAPGIRLVAVRMHDKVGILSVSKESANLIQMLDAPAAEIMATRSSNPQVFSDNLNKLLDRFKKPRKVSEMMEEA